MEYTDWERQKRQEWMRRQGDQVLKVSAGPNGDRFETVGDLVKHIFSAEKRYVERLSARPMTDTTSLPNDNIEALFQFGRESRESLREFIETFPADKWDVPQEQNLVVAVIVVTPRKSVTHILLWLDKRERAIALFCSEAFPCACETRKPVRVKY